MNRISPFMRRCLFLLLLALMVASDSIAQRFEPRIVFASNRDGDWDIYSMDANGDKLAQLTNHPASDEYPACSPDGRRIAFTSERGLTHDPYVMDSDGDNVIRLTQDNFFESRPSWSPDGTRIAFGSFRVVVGNSEIYAMAATEIARELKVICVVWQTTSGTMSYRVGRQMEARLRLSPPVTAPSILPGTFS